MKSTLKDFLNYHLTKLEGPDWKKEIEAGERYVGSYGGDFNGTLFRTKQEAREMWQQRDQDENKVNQNE